MIRRGDIIRIGPIRITVAYVTEDTAEVHVAYGSVGLGSKAGVPLEALEKLGEDTRRAVASIQEWRDAVRRA